MNGKIPSGNTWQFPPGFRPDQPPFSYEEQCRSALPQPRPFDVDMAAMRSTQPFLPQFIPRFGLPLPDFDYRLNEFNRNGLFGTCSFGSPITAHPLSHSFGIGAPITSASASSMMDSLHLPPPLQQVVQNPMSVIQRLQSSTSDTSEKPPVLTAETYDVKEEETTVFDQKPIFSEDKTICVVPGEEKKAEKLIRNGEEGLFGPSFYPRTLPVDLTGGFLKREMSTPPTLERPEDFSRRPDPMIVKKEYPMPMHDCQVCLSTHANGLHFGARTCAACAAFFRRTISDDKRYVCKRNQRCNNASRDGTGYRKICRSCRMKRCIDIGMLPENVQHKRSHRETPPNRKTTGFGSFFPGFYPHIQPSI